MLVKDIITHLETIAPLFYQEQYDNAGLLTGSPAWKCSGVLVCLDVMEAVVQEAVAKHCNLIVAHHPLIFKGLRKLTGDHYIEQAVIAAIKNEVAIYALHTNLDNVQNGVNGQMADRLGLVNRAILAPKAGILRKLFTFVPANHIEQVRDAIFAAGGGQIGNYSECSFATAGTGSFKAGQGTRPYVGAQGARHYENELKLEVVFPGFMENRMVNALLAAHPYEEVAYDIIALAHPHPGVGSGLTGMLPQPLDETAFLRLLQRQFNLQVIRHTPLTGRPVTKVALCGGSGAFLTEKALALQADVFITADIKYHEFFEAQGRMLIADIGHYESEQFTIDLIYNILTEKFNNFALLKTEINTNPVHYFQH